MAQARDLLARRAAESSDTGPSAGNLGQLIFSESLRPEFVLTIPAGMPFSEPEHQVFSWDVALNADDLVGLLGTLSWIITMPDDERDRVITTARHFLRELLGIDGQVTVDVTFRADAWRCRRDDA
jgi:hypothetical protein